MKNNHILDVDAFVRSISVNRKASHAFFLGAGASVSSKVPSASMCVWHWKREIFLTQNPGLEDQFRELSLPSVRDRIQHWLDAQGTYPALGSPEEYGYYVAACYPVADNRRHFFDDLVHQARPSAGYHLLCMLAEAGVVCTVWTTNFDALTPKAATSASITVVEVGLDTPHRALRQQRRGELLHIALHGDFRYDALKNTEEELQQQDASLLAEMIDHLRHSNLIVVGYSGRDKSIMDALNQAYSQPGSGWLYWCGYGEEDLSGPVAQLIDVAWENGRQAYYIPARGFDDLLSRLALRCLPEDVQSRVQEIRKLGDPSDDFKHEPFLLPDGDASALIKSNAFQVNCPSELLQFDWTGASSEGAWRRLRSKVEGREIVAGLLKGKTLALGTIDDIKDAFNGELVGPITRTPISNSELGRDKGVVVQLLRDALVRSMAVTRELETNGYDLLWEKEPYETRTVLSVQCRVYHAVTISLRRYGGKQYMILEPTIVGKGMQGEELSKTISKELHRAVLSKQYNAQYNQALERWRKWLLPLKRSTTFEYPDQVGSSFRYSVHSIPAYAKIVAQQKGPTIPLQDSYKASVTHVAATLEEPELVFRSYSGHSVRETSPVRGLTDNLPYDHNLRLRGLANDIRVGVVCPDCDSVALARYLQHLNIRQQVTSKTEYLVDYPGFGKAFGTNLDTPEPSGDAWVTCPDPAIGATASQGALHLRKMLTQCIDAVAASTRPNVIFIYIPQRWRSFERYETDVEMFDLHDFVKAYCIQRGLATQFIREETLQKRHQGEVMWWLALSTYVKSMRTPWVLANADPSTVYAGLGFSIQKNVERGQHILLGCSHIYNSEGLGLNFRLSKIEEPIITRQGNPFMSREDARRMAESTVQLYYDARFQLPRRVVVHKRTPFRKDEVQGLLEGFSDVVEIDMVEINFEPSLRYLASTYKNSHFTDSQFPVSRGTVVALDDRNALLWVHGAARNLRGTKSQSTYYQGKARIPAPLIIRRHYGRSSLAMLSQEILGLSKMNWNTLDFYTRLPSTVQSSNEIARIGNLLERMGTRAYDYRLFI